MVYERNEPAGASGPHAGCLVRTTRRSVSGICKAPVEKTFDREGTEWAAGHGWEFPVSELEVIRPALGAGT